MSLAIGYLLILVIIGFHNYKRIGEPHTYAEGINTALYIYFAPQVLAKKNNSNSLKLSKNEKERLAFWSGRKAAFPACGAMAPDYYCMDGSIPRGKLAEALKEINKLSKKIGMSEDDLRKAIYKSTNNEKIFDKNYRFGPIST